MDQGPRARSGVDYFPRAPPRRAAEAAELWLVFAPVRACFAEPRRLAPGSSLGLPESPKSDRKEAQLLSCGTQRKQEQPCTSTKLSFSQPFFKRVMVSRRIMHFQ